MRVVLCSAVTETLEYGARRLSTFSVFIYILCTMVRDFFFRLFRVVMLMEFYIFSAQEQYSYNKHTYSTCVRRVV